MGFPRLVEKVSGQDSGSFFIGGNPLALRNRSIPLITIEQESFWCRARSIIGGERTAGRQSKRFVTAPEERVRCSIGGRGGTGLTATMFDLSAAFSR